MILKKYLEFVQDDFEPIKSFHLKDELCPDIWEGEELDDHVRKTLMRIGQDFYKETEIKAGLVDVVLCGSLCNYNWSEKYSDYDLHIIVHLNEVDENPEIAEKICDLSKKIWNLKHDIKVAGYEVEVAIQDEEDLKSSILAGRMGGVFSLTHGQWIKKPERKEFVPDEKLIRSKAETVMAMIDELEDSIDSEPYDVFITRLDKAWKKIKELRQSGLDSEGGEFSIGNLVFKLLRRNGYSGKVMRLRREAYDRQFEKKTYRYEN